MKFTRAFITLLLCTFFTYAQKQSAQEREIDSLLQVAELSSDSIWYETHREIGFYYIFNNRAKASILLSKALDKARTGGDAYWETKFIYTYGVLKDVSGELDSARLYFKKSLDRSVENEFKDIEVVANNGLGMNHWNKREFEEALAYFFRAFQLNKEVGNEANNGKYLNNIGLIYQELGMYDKALDYHHQALSIRRKFNSNRDIPASLNNIAICHREKGEFELGLTAVQEAISVAKTENMQTLEYGCKSTLSNIYADLNQTDKAIPILEELIQYNKENGIETIASITPHSNLINAYNTINKPEKALECVEIVEREFRDKPAVRGVAFEYYFNVAQTYFMLGRPIKGESNIAKGLHIKDSLFSAENAAEFANLEIKFNVAEKERALAESRANLAESELKVEQRNNLIYGSLALAAILGLSGYLFFSQQRLKNKQLKKESELNEALARIETQNRLQEQRLRISRDLHDNIGSQLTFVTSSVDSMKFGLGEGQVALEEKLERVSEFTTQTIYELRDTIWAMNKSDISFEDVKTRIANFIDKARTANDAIVFDFSVAKNISDTVIFTSVQGMNLYRIIQEVVNNALKYAEANRVNIFIEKMVSVYHVTIDDDGKGFETENMNLGHGLSNIKKRAKDLRGDVQIQSEISTGTKVILKFPA